VALRYTPYFCEENVYQLALDAVGSHAVFVTNAAKQVAMWQQRAGDPVVWDYHVVLVADGGVTDLDTTIPGGPRVSLARWIAGTFPVDERVPDPLRPRFRVVPRDELVRTFSSDRSHMRDPESGGPLQPFPPWPAIDCPLGGNTLPRYLDLADPIAGDVVDLAGLRARFSQRATAG
jgi:hypothetical protein